MALERRYQLGTKRADSSLPGLIQKADDTIWVVNADGTEFQIAENNGGGAVGVAGGVLAGTFPNPSFASDMATQAELDEIASLVGSPYWKSHDATSAGDITLTLSAIPPVGFASRASMVAIDPGSGNCEIRAISSVSSAELTFDRTLQFAHGSGAAVVWLTADYVPTAFFGVKSDSSTLDTISMQAAIDEVSLAGIWLNGFNRAWSQMDGPLWCRSGARMRSINLRATSGWGPIDLTNAQIQGMQGNIRAFTADAATNTITTALAHGVPGDGVLVGFKPASPLAFPGGMQAGRIHYAFNRTTNTLQVTDKKDNAAVAALAGAATVNTFDTALFPSSGTLRNISGATWTYSGKTATSFTGCSGTPALASGAVILGEAIDITSDGAGTVYCEINSQERLLLDDVYLSLFNVPGQAANGIFCFLQQPNWWRKVRVDYGKIGVWIRGQENASYGLEITHCDVGLKLSDGAKMMYFYDTNIETCGSIGLLCAEGTAATRGTSNNGFWGLHEENNPIMVKLEHALGLVIEAWHCALASSSQIGVQVDAASSANTAYTIVGCNPAGAPASAKFINDLDRGYDVLISELPGGASAPTMNMFSQPTGSSVPLLGEYRSVAKAAAYTTVLWDRTITCNAAPAAFQVTLMSAVGIKGKQFTVKKIDVTGNAVTVGTTSSQTIDGAATKVLAAQWDTIRVESDGANWLVV